MFRSLSALTLLLACTVAQAVESHAVVFIYHRFGDDRYPSTNIRMGQFEQQLDYLDHHGYHIWPLARIMEYLDAGRPLPDRTVALTVDDAYRSVYEHAFPLLKKRHIPATVFVSTAPVDERHGDYMSWGQMREMKASGIIQFANHSSEHGHLAQPNKGESEAAWRQRVRTDLNHAQQRLQEELGTPADGAPKLFAYPYGEYSRALAEVVAQLGFTAFGQQSGALGAQSDRLALPRFPMAEAFADMKEFAVKAASLPLPVRHQRPWDPVSGENPPRLSFTVGESGADLDRLACYGANGRLPVQRLGPATFSVQASSPLPPGRSRYNCTAPHRNEPRYYWFSQPWLIVAPPGKAR